MSVLQATAHSSSSHELDAMRAAFSSRPQQSVGPQFGGAIAEFGVEISRSLIVFDSATDRNYFIELRTPSPLEGYEFQAAEVEKLLPSAAASAALAGWPDRVNSFAGIYAASARTSLPSAASGKTTPEPTVLVLMLLALPAILLRRPAKHAHAGAPA